jgi:hypothetical protein
MQQRKVSDGSRTTVFLRLPLDIEIPVHDLLDGAGIGGDVGIAAAGIF